MAEMKHLVFGEGLLAPALDGSKCFTVRKYREGSHDFVKGEIVQGEFKDGLTILLQITQDTKKDTFGNLKKSKRNLDKNGYYFDKQYFEDLANYYPDLTRDDVGAIVFFEILKVSDIPVVRFNEHAHDLVEIWL